MNTTIDAQETGGQPRLIDRIRVLGIPSSTVHQSRLMIFQPTRRPEMIEQNFTTAWGKVRIKGRLGQQHADLLEAILFFGTKPKELSDGRVKLLVDPHQVSTATRLEGGTLRRALDDLMQALVEIKEPTHLACLGHFVDHIDFARRADGTFVTSANPLGGARKLWRVDLGKALVKMIDADLWMRRNPAGVAAVRHGISQAVARFLLSHGRGFCEGWTADALIKAVAGDLSPHAMRDRRRELASDSAALAELGASVPALLMLTDTRREQKPGGREQKPGGASKNPGGASKNPGP